MNNNTHNQVTISLLSKDLGESIKTRRLTVGLHLKEKDSLGNIVPGESLGSIDSVNFNHFTQTFGKLYNKSHDRAIIVKGLADLSGAIRLSFLEVDQDQSGKLILENEKEIPPFYNGPHYEDFSEHESVYIEMQDYVATMKIK